MNLTRIILAGGFLGSGKTTLLWQAAKMLTEQGLRVGLITNDQAPQLVDSALLTHNHLKVEEVSGSCFCCNFNGFTDAIRHLRLDVQADVIIAEPVGSCADLSATILQPLKEYWNTELRVSPLSVLTDPHRLQSILDGGNAGLHPDAAYIVKKQMEEADVILINKADLLSADEMQKLIQHTASTFPAATIYPISALKGTGIRQWLDVVMKSNEAGKRLLDINYDTYAHGEAVLGWLNGTILLHGKTTDWNQFAKQLLTSLSEQFDKAHLSVGHVKVILENGDQYAMGNLTGKAETLSMRGDAGTSGDAKLVINARVETSPEALDRMVNDVIDGLTGADYQKDVEAWKYLQPGRPNPTHRFREVV